MFERYTEKARRVIFFARYEASQYGSPYIETEHLLLGLLRETRQLAQLLPLGSSESIRKQIEDGGPKFPPSATSVDLRLSNECKRVLAYAAEEAERLSDKHIGSEHLLLGLLREEKSFAAHILQERGLALEQLRTQLANRSGQFADTWTRESEPIIIHGSPHKSDTIQRKVATIRSSKWHWHKSPFRARDVIVHRRSGKMSFDTSLASDTENFDLMPLGWNKDICLICDWDLFESETEHGVGYTNGRDWVCAECHEKFLQGPDYFATSHPESS